MMRFSFLLLNKYYPSDHIKKNEIDEAYGTYGVKKRRMQRFGGET